MKLTRVYVWIGRAVVFGVGFLLVAACTFIWIGMQKNGQTFADLFQPRKQVVESYSGSDEGKLPTLEKPAPKSIAAPVPISGGKTNPVAYSAPTQNAAPDEAVICPSCKRFHLKSVTCASDEAFVSSVIKSRPKASKARKAKTKRPTYKQPTPLPIPTQPQTITWNARDGNEHTGRGEVKVPATAGGFVFNRDGSRGNEYTVKEK